MLTTETQFSKILRSRFLDNWSTQQRVTPAPVRHEQKFTDFFVASIIKYVLLQVDINLMQLIFQKKETKSLKGLHDNKETGLKRSITIIPTETTWTFFTNCQRRLKPNRRSRIASATFLLSQGLARSVNLSSNNFEEQLDTEGINCLDINRKFPHFKKERQWETSAIELFGKSNINIMIDVKNYKKIATLICNNNKKALCQSTEIILFFKLNLKFRKLRKSDLAKTLK